MCVVTLLTEQNVIRSIQVGSMIMELQGISLSIFLFNSRHPIHLDVNWYLVTRTLGQIFLAGLLISTFILLTMKFSLNGKSFGVPIPWIDFPAATTLNY